MKAYKGKKYLFLILVLLLFASCKKQDQFLDAKPNQSLIVPGTLNDYQTILNNTNIFNFGNDPALGQMSSDDFYVLPEVLITLSATERNSYFWAAQIYDADYIPSDWSSPYLQVYYANTVLDGLATITPSASQQNLYNQLRGSALFFRSYAFYNLVQTFALPYNATTAGTDLGIPLRLTADITKKSVRATQQATYNQVINDIKLAMPLLAANTTYPTIPSKIAANAMLARVYLAMGDYKNALTYSNACLSLFGTLIDFNTLNSPTTTSVSSGFIAEDIFHSSLVNYEMFAIRRNSVVDSNLYASFAENDLRRTKFIGILDSLPQYPRFIGSYDYDGNKFDGLATDEIYLIRAECYARQGNTDKAMADLNTLLINRWKTGTFIPYTASSSTNALIQILSERRKELLYRGLRWTDLRRLNKDPKYAITLERNSGGTLYTLPANDPKYALPIPQSEINLSGIQQNQR